MDFDELDMLEEEQAAAKSADAEETAKPVNGTEAASAEAAASGFDLDALDALEAAAEAQQAVEQPRWVAESMRRLQAFREGVQVLPEPPELPARLQAGPCHINKLPPFKRLSAKQMEVESKKNMPGEFSGLEFPHNAAQLKSFGAEWYTRAFHRFGTLPRDNKVKRVVSVEQLPNAGFDTAGGAGQKAFVTLEYEKEDPELHTQLFAKFPFDYFGGPTARQYRMQISAYADMDGPELSTSCFLEHLLPCPTPKLYFCDISRETTNYVLISERVMFGRRGRVENNRIVEKLERKPFEVLPVCGKYQDHLLEDPASIYFCIFRVMAHISAWDQQGRYDDFFGPMTKYTVSQYDAQVLPRKTQPARRLQTVRGAATTFTSQGIEFATKVAPQVFTKNGRDPKMLEKFQRDIVEMVAHFDDINVYVSRSSDFVSASHMNLQADNAYFWNDEHGDLDCGVFDWGGFSRVTMVTRFMGCLGGADADVLDAHEEGLIKMFCDEYERYGGPHLDWTELLLNYRLVWPGMAMDSCQWIERDVYPQVPKEKWKSIRTILDDEVVNNWNTRCRATTLVNVLEYWPRRDFRKIFDDWKRGPGKRYLTTYGS